VERVRRLLEEWFEIFPESGDELNKKDLAKRFRNEKDDRSVLAAFFEMYCHALLFHQGFRCAVREHTRTPNYEFLVSPEGGQEFCLECTTVSGMSDKEYKARKVIDLIYDDLDEKLESPDYFLFVKVEKEGKEAPSISRMIPTLNSWLSELDYDEATYQHDQDERWFISPPSKFVKDMKDSKGWHLDFIVIPKGDARGKSGVRPVGIEFTGATWVKFGVALRNRLEEKASKYGELSVPYVIAVDGLDLLADDYDVQQVLTGTEGIHEYGPSGNIELTEVRLNNFFFGPTGPRNRRVSAILSVVYLTPNQVASKVPVLWINTWADYQIDPSLWSVPKMVLSPTNEKKEPMHIEAVVGKQPWETLGLEKTWPFSVQKL